MRGTWMLAAVAVALLMASPTIGSDGERYEDAVGDAVGDAPDIIAVTVGEPEGPLLSFSVELDSEPPIGADDTHSDMLAIALDTVPEVTFPELDGYSIMALGATLPADLEEGSHLLAGNELYWHVVDIETEGPAVTFRVDRKLLGDPAELYFRVYSAALHGTLYTEQTDHYPEEDEPPARYALSREGD